MKISNTLSAAACAMLCAVSANAATLQPGDDFIRDYIRYQVWSDGTLQAFFDVNSYGGGSCLDYGFPSPKVITIPETVDAGDGYGPRTVTKLGASSFYLLYEMENVYIPKTIEWIRSSSFQGCLALKSIDIPDGVWRIDNAFIDCKSLDILVFPSTLERVDAGCVQGCANMSMILWLASNPNPGNAYTAVNAPNENCEIYVPAKDLQNLNGWEGKKFALGPYVENPVATPRSISLTRAHVNQMGEEALSFTLNGVKISASQPLVWEGLEADTDYTLTIDAEYEDHKYQDALVFRTAKDESGVSELTASALTAYAAEGALVMQTGYACEVHVYSVDGKCVVSDYLAAGEQKTYALTPGLYTVSDGVKSLKVIL